MIIGNDFDFSLLVLCLDSYFSNPSDRNTHLHWRTVCYPQLEVPIYHLDVEELLVRKGRSDCRKPDCKSCCCCCCCCWIGVEGCRGKKEGRKDGKGGTGCRMKSSCVVGIAEGVVEMFVEVPLEGRWARVDERWVLEVEWVEMGVDGGEDSSLGRGIGREAGRGIASEVA